MPVFSPQIIRHPTLVDWTNPINNSSGLNRGLISWFLPAPTHRGGTTWYDLCKRWDGTLTSMDPNTDWIESDRRGSFGALDFDGLDDKVVLTGIENKLNLMPQLTVCMWARRETGTTFRNTFASNTSSNIWCGTGGSGLGDAGDLFFRPDNNNQDVYSTSSPLVLNTWVHIAYVFNGSLTGNQNRAKVYASGKNITAGDRGTIGTTIGAAATIAIGFGTGGWNGKLDDIRIFDRALSDEELLAICKDSSTGYNQTLNGILAGPHESSSSSLTGTVTAGVEFSEDFSAQADLDGDISEGAEADSTFTTTADLDAGVQTDVDAGDTFTSLADLVATVTEGADAGDTFDESAQLLATFLEGTNAGDTFSTSTMVTGSVSEGANAGDTQTGLLQALGSVLEGVETDETITALATLLASIVEAATAGDSVTAKGGYLATLSTGINAGDTFSTEEDPPDVPGIEYKLSGDKTHYKLTDDKFHYKLTSDRLHHRVEET